MKPICACNVSVKYFTSGTSYIYISLERHRNLKRLNQIRYGKFPIKYCLNKLLQSYVDYTKISFRVSKVVSVCFAFNLNTLGWYFTDWLRRYFLICFVVTFCLHRLVSTRKHSFEESTRMKREYRLIIAFRCDFSCWNFIYPITVILFHWQKWYTVGIWYINVRVHF